MAELSQPQDTSLEEDLGLTDAVPTMKAAAKRRNYNLNSELLLSRRGLPELRKYATRFKFKRHPKKTDRGNPRRDRLVGSTSFTNLTRILQMYQVWGHNLFPKARFADFIELTSKAGEKRDVKLFRMKCIEEEIQKKRGDDIDVTAAPEENGDDEEIRRPATTGTAVIDEDELFDDMELMREMEKELSEVRATEPEQEPDLNDFIEEEDTDALEAMREMEM